MDEEDWKQFCFSRLAVMQRQELARILDDPALAPGVIGPVRADCLAYESYHLSKTMRLSMPIFTMWGANDCIATPRVLKTWKDVAKGRIEHMIIVLATELRRNVLVRLLTWFISIPSPVLWSSRTLSEVSGAHTDCYVRKIKLEPPPNSSKGRCSDIPWR